MATAHDADATNRTLVFADPPGSAHYVYARLPASSLAATLDAAFVSSVDAASYPGGLEAETDAHRFDDAVNLRALWAHKYVLDLDGAGYSGKFFALLASDSAVLKTSVHDEFWADWIQPWCACLPLPSAVLCADARRAAQAALCPALADVPRAAQRARVLLRRARRGPARRQLVRARAAGGRAALARRRPQAAPHRARGQAVARDGRAPGRHGGCVSAVAVAVCAARGALTARHTAYVYRLCLEYARLWADDRDAMSYR
jgi:hypothetical protein